MHTAFSPSYISQAREAIAETQARTPTLSTWPNYLILGLVVIGICFIMNPGTATLWIGGGIMVVAIIAAIAIGNSSAVGEDLIGRQTQQQSRWLTAALGILIAVALVLSRFVLDENADYYITVQIAMAIVIGIVMFRIARSNAVLPIKLHRELTEANAHKTSPNHQDTPLEQLHIGALPIDQLRILAALDHARALHSPEDKVSYAITYSAL